MSLTWRLAKPVIVLLTACIPSSVAQTPPQSHSAEIAGAPKEFDVVSIHPSDPAMQTEDLNYDTGMITAKGIGLKFLIQSAYKLKDFQVEGLPSSLEHKKYDIIAKMIDASNEKSWQLSDVTVANAREELFAQRLQNILTTRFNLKGHFEKRDGKVLMLRRASTNVHLVANEGAQNSQKYLRMHNVEGGMQIDGKGQTMDSLANELSYVFHMEVKNGTDLGGNYDFQFSWRDDQTQTETTLPDINTAMREALGMKIERVLGVVEYYIVDHVDPPTPN